MNIHAIGRGFLPKDIVLPFVDIILKGYGQIFVCPNRLTGLCVFLAILVISRATCLLTIIGVVSSTLVAYWIGARPVHIHSGCYGFNGVVLGIAWPWFVKLNAISVMMLFLLSAASSVILKYFVGFGSRKRSNLPVFSIPSLILVWLVCILLSVPSWKLLRGPDQSIMQYIQSYESSVLRLYDKHWTTLTFNMYLDTFRMHLLVMVFITIGIFQHSRVSTKVALTTTIVTLGLVYFIKGINGLREIDIYLYNTVPCGLALGGIFLVLNRKTWLIILCNIVLITLTVYMGLDVFQFPFFVAPFNFFTILSIWLVKKGILKKEDGFYAVPMELVFSPETAIEWRNGEIYAQNYWKTIEHSWSASNS